MDGERVRREARGLGFELVGIVDDAASKHMARFRAWVDAGNHGEMGYLSRPDAVERRGDIAAALPGFQSAIVVGHEYGTPFEEPANPGRAIVARYARGSDYHDVMTARLTRLGDRLEALVSRPVARRIYVDTGPVLERELASRAGLGWFGKNTMLLSPRRGSYFFLGLLLTDVPLEASLPFTEDHCGTCTRCLDACPTGALLGRDRDGAPIMDARRCIAYLTIELKGPIPHPLRGLLGNRVYGCDICQEVCPWNERFSRPTPETSYATDGRLHDRSLVDLAADLLALSGKGFRREFAESPVLRAGRRGLLRNVCVALGNWGSEGAVPVLEAALSDRTPLVRGHAAWALGQIGSDDAVRILNRRADMEPDPTVEEEIRLALGGRDGPAPSS